MKLRFIHDFLQSVSLDNALPSSTNQGLNCAFAGDHVSLTLAGTGSGSSTLDPANLALGMIVCDPSQPVKVSKHFAAKLVVLNVETPITKGFACVLHYGGVTEAAVLKKLIAQVSKGTGEILKRKPRILAKNSSAQVSKLKTGYINSWGSNFLAFTSILHFDKLNCRSRLRLKHLFALKLMLKVKNWVDSCYVLEAKLSQLE